MGFFGKSNGSIGLATRPAHPPTPLSPFRNLGTAMTNPYALGHYPPHVLANCRQKVEQFTRELSGLKKAPIINPNMPMAEKWLATLHG